MKCIKCENIQKDPVTGMMICLTCGTVHEESQIVEALEFDDNQNAAGTFMDPNKPSYFYPGGRNTLSQMVDQTQRRLNKTYRQIEKVSKTLTIPENVVKSAKRLYNIASNKKFTQGRKTDQIVGAILYLACRWNKTKHLLIDFSEVLHLNLFVIGTLYIKLVKLLGLQINIIDPCLYMHRFCNKFNLGNKAKEVEKTALKILQFMKRDWITTGRRPSGLIGACILISAKLHKLNIDINLISNVVHVCSQTILNRIEEFSLTQVAKMTMEEFESFKESHFYPGSDPPAFKKSIKENEKKEEEEKKIENEEEENNNNGKIIENGGQMDDNNNNNNININDIYNLRSGKSGLSKNSDLNLSQNRSGLNIQKGKSGISNKNDSFSLSLRQNKSGLSNNSDFSFFRPSNSGISKTNKINFNDSEMITFGPKKSGLSRGGNRISELSLPEEKLSNIPDNEDYKYIYSKEEYGVRKQFWEIMFKDWIESQKEKEEKEGKEKKVKVREPRKRIKKMIFKSDGNQKTSFEAIKSSNKFGRKINYSYIKSIMSKRK
jgi:transcription factor IIIB subunit 2